MKKETVTNSSEETRKLGKSLAGLLKAGTAVLLEGDLGSGKTTFVKGLAEGLGFRHPHEVKSPTFVLLHVYATRIPVYHFDLYRLETEAELEALGFSEFLGDPAGICCIEWAEKAGAYAPEQAVKVRFKITGPRRRNIEILLAEGNHEKSR